MQPVVVFVVFTLLSVLLSFDESKLTVNCAYSEVGEILFRALYPRFILSEHSLSLLSILFCAGCVLIIDLCIYNVHKTLQFTIDSWKGFALYVRLCTVCETTAMKRILNVS